MSKFLGPIHFWLYDKIIFQDNLNKYLCNEKLSEEIKKFGDIKGEDLETIIDTDNIHGFLQSLVNIVEPSYSYIIEERLKSENIEDIKKEIFEFGKENAISENLPSDIFNKLNNYLLDGMPCDRSLEVVENNDDELIYTVNNNTHERFWGNVDSSIYFILRNELINGMINGSGCIHKIINENTFTIERNN